MTFIKGSQLTPEVDELVSQQVDILVASSILYAAAAEASVEAARAGHRLSGPQAIEAAMRDLDMGEEDTLAAFGVANITRKVLGSTPFVAREVAKVVAAHKSAK